MSKVIKNLYLVRHGRTLFNERRKIQGWSDSPLTEEGRTQAKIAGDFMREHEPNIDHFYSSTQERAEDTLLEMFGEDIAYKRDKRIKEWNFGIFEGESEDLNPKHNNPSGSYEDYWVQWGGEDYREVAERMYDFCLEVMAKADHENVLCVSHAGCIHAMMVIHRDSIGYPKYHSANCGILHLQYDGEGFKFVKYVNPISEEVTYLE